MILHFPSLIVSYYWLSSFILKYLSIIFTQCPGSTDSRLINVERKFQMFILIEETKAFFIAIDYFTALLTSKGFTRKKIIAFFFQNRAIHNYA